MREATPEEIHRDRLIHGNPYRHASEEGFRATKPTSADIDVEINLNPSEIRGGNPIGSKFSSDELETIARRFQINLYRSRDQIPEFGESDEPLDVLNPRVALQQIGYTCEEVSTLGRFEVGTDRFEIAAIIKDSERRVRISAGQPTEVKNFTAGHELAHALLHESEGRHRDRPLNSTSSVTDRDQKEWEADKFSAYFLMPRKQVTSEFKSRFGSAALLNEDFVFNLNADLDALEASLREFSRAVAEAGSFGDRHFMPLHAKFGVSVEAMAIRLEELDLVST